MWISSLTIYGFGSAWGLSGAGSCLPFTIINTIVRQFHLFEVFSFNWIEICPFISYQIICLIHSLANCFEKNPFAWPSAHACAHTHTHTHSFAWQAFYETALTVSLLPLDWFHDYLWVAFCSMKNAYPAQLPLDKLSKLSWQLSWLLRVFLCLV